MCCSLVDTICVCCLKYLNWIVLSCSVSQKPSRQAPPTGPQSGDRLWMGVLGVPTGVLGGYVGQSSIMLCVANVVYNSEGAYIYSDVYALPTLLIIEDRFGEQWMIC